MAFISKWEGFRSKAYQDVIGLWTIGYGHLIKPHEMDVLRNKELSTYEALALLADDVKEAEHFVTTLVKVSLTQHQFDALVSFTYNCGAANLMKCTLLKCLNEGRFIAAAEEFPKWNKAGGKVVQGLTNRRMAERQLFLTGDYNA